MTTAFDHEVNQEVGSASNLEFSWDFRCLRTQNVRSAPHSQALSNLLGAENRPF